MSNKGPRPDDTRRILRVKRARVASRDGREVREFSPRCSCGQLLHHCTCDGESPCPGKGLCVECDTL